MGYFTNYIHQIVPECQICGVDISKTAIEKAKCTFDNIHFECDDLLSMSKRKGQYKNFLLAEIMWYILEDIDEIVWNLSKNYKDRLVIINQTFYHGKQCYGTNYFTNLNELVDFLPWKCLFKAIFDSSGSDAYSTHSVFRI